MPRFSSTFIPQLILIFSFLYCYCDCVAIQPLTGEWFVHDANKPEEKYAATVPGGIYTDLMNNKIIGDVFYGFNDTATRWVANQNWTYQKEFTVLDDILRHQQIELVFDGLDTIATVSLNGKTIGSTDNMFLRYIFDVKDLLQPGTNNIEVKFISPILMAQELTKKSSYVVPPTCPPPATHGECNANQLRKMQSSFSWDWGPALPSMGIWKPVYLDAYNSTTIRYLVVSVGDSADEDTYKVQTATYLGGRAGQKIQGQLAIEADTDVNFLSYDLDVDTQIEDGQNEVRVDFSFNVPKNAVKQWWPNGYGEQNLYKLVVHFKTETESRLAQRQIGYRKVELVQEPINEDFLSFYFRVNGVPIFAKGSNEIPLNILPEKGQDVDLVKKIMKSVKDSNMNMLRVWGGGVYESDTFYDLADEYGIMIWQDFMFACAMYPTYPGFLKNVEEEVRHQVRRLSSHPSIALFAGNNENEAALVQDWYNTGSNFKLYAEDYIKLYVDTIKKNLEDLDPQLIYVTSSPSNGKMSEEDDYIAANPQDQRYGDVHFYNYVVNSLYTATYPIPRFASEYGYQSLPDVDAWMTVTDNLDDLNPESKLMVSRQHHPLGTTENFLLIQMQMPLNSSSPNYPKTFIFYSQILQALSIKFETELYRSYMGRLVVRDYGNTMGALYWQLNDVWVAPTWSGIDFTGKWKMLQYFVKDFFAPTLITGFLNVERKLSVYVVSEVPALLTSSLNASALIQVYNWNSFDPVYEINKNITVEFGRSQEIASLDTDNLLVEAGCGQLNTARQNCFFYLTLQMEKLILAPTNFVLVDALKNSNLQPTRVDITLVVAINNSSNNFSITIQASGISAFVWLDSHKIPGRFSENGFLQLTELKVITFEAEQSTNIEDLRSKLTVTHFKDQQYVV